MALLSWDIVDPVEYTADQELSLNLHFEAPADTEAGYFYVLGGLYTADAIYIPDTRFGVLKAAEVDYGVNDLTQMSLWELEPEQGVDLPCRFTLDRSGVTLGLFLTRMVGDEPSLENDEEIAQIQVRLVAPVSILTVIMPMMIMVMMMAMIMPIMGEAVSGLEKQPPAPKLLPERTAR